MKHQPIYSLFQEQVDRQPDAIAIAWQDQRVTYRTVSHKAHHIAHYLRAAGCAKGEIVAIAAENTVEMVPALLGTLEAGAAFVVLDPKLPLPRLHKMVAVAEPSWYLVEGPFAKLAQELGARPGQILISTAEGAVAGAIDLTQQPPQTETVALHSEPDDLCYLYFTSGTTGLPKAIAGRLKSVDHFIQWEIETFALDATVRVSQLTAPTFDAYLRDIFAPLCAGGTICVPDSPQTLLDATSLASWLERAGVTLIHTVPSLFRILLSEELGPQRFPELHHVCLSGEPVLPSDVRQWTDLFGERIALHNFYGPSETTMIKFCHHVAVDDKNKRFVPIGKPMQGCKAMILDARGNPCAPGAVGEIVIRTPYRSLGYYRQPELTAAAFIQNPFNPHPDDLLYKTGDFGRQLPDGSFECLGRMDQQVKIRGVRIELGEIETLLNEHPELVEAAVVASELEGETEKRLVAYVVPATGVKIDDHVLHTFLAEELPETLVPSLFVHLDQLPRLINGKIDRKALPAPKLQALDQKAGYVAPRNQDEETMAAIWAKILKVERVGVQDNFFEVGGHSLLATLVLSRVRKAFDLTLPLGILFEAKTIEQLCLYIASARATSAGAGQGEGPKPISRQQPLPLSFGQQGLYFIYRLDPHNPLFRVPIAVRIRGPLDRAALSAAFNRLAERQESLRTRFVLEGERPVQVIDPWREMTLAATALPGEGPLEARIQQTVDADAAFDFNLERGPLWQARLYQLDAEDHLLTLAFHHIIMDEWSMGVLVTELNALYSAIRAGKPADLPTLPVQYADFSFWQQQHLGADRLAGSLDWWKRRLQGAPEFCSLPGDRERPPRVTSAGRRTRFSISAEHSDQLRNFCKAEQVTPFQTLLALLGWLMRWYTQQHDMVLGVMVAGRQQPEVEHLIGLFVDQLPLRLQPQDPQSFRAYLSAVRENVTESFKHQDVPFNTLVEALKPKRNPSHAAVHQVLFAFQPIAIDSDRLDDLETELIYPQWVSAQLDLILHLTDSPQGIRGHVEYNTDLYEPATIAAFIGHLQFLVGWLPGQPETDLATVVESLSEMARKARIAEREQQLQQERAGLSLKGRRRGVGAKGDEA